MYTRWQGWLAAIGVTAVTGWLVILDLSDDGFRRWWLGHALTTDTVAGLLVVLITVLVVDQVTRRRRVRDRSRAVAAQAAIMVEQASRTSRAVAAALDGSGDRSAASEEVRTYLMMLLVGAPVLIDDRVSRNFLEQAQHLGGAMARTVIATGKTPGVSPSTARLDDAVQRLRTASTPLLQWLNPEERIAASEAESS